MAVGSNLLVAEEVSGGDLLNLTPVLAVGGEGDVCGAVEEDVCEGGVRPGREDVVVRAQDGLRGARRGDDERRDGAEAEEHEAVAAVVGGEVAEGDMREAPNEVQVADDGQPARWRREHSQQLLPFSRRRRRRRVAPHEEEENYRASEQEGVDHSSSQQVMLMQHHNPTLGTRIDVDDTKG
ncbi:hypothetical protein U9M48_009598 [Paspalum notatum var. saurae]|uniref:Uncharacterized protein n=1 Tax=Paspalum notatum var. saurae TaxID=547442 RepID=A0AAQ3SRU1_PASNO